MTHRPTAIFVICIAQALLSHAYADETTVFGIPLGQDFSLPECKKKSYGYSIGTDQICFERISGKEKETGPIITESVMVRFPITEAPAIVKGNVLLARVIDGKLEGLAFDTMGIRNADIVLAKLKEKFGEPKVVLPGTVKNRLGASFETYDVAWSVQNIVVLFKSVTGSLDSGLVHIDTRKGSEDRSRAIKEITKDRLPL